VTPFLGIFDFRSLINSRPHTTVVFLFNTRSSSPALVFLFTEKWSLTKMERVFNNGLRTVYGRQPSIVLDGGPVAADSAAAAPKPTIWHRGGMVREIFFPAIKHISVRTPVKQNQYQNLSVFSTLVVRSARSKHSRLVCHSARSSATVPTD
jgi:hypothetical protein